MTNVEVDTREQFRNAVSENTAMIGLLARLEYERQDDPEVMKPHEFIEIGRRAGVPVLVDAASELPPARNLTAYSSHRERGFQSKLNSESIEAERSSKRWSVDGPPFH